MSGAYVGSELELFAAAVTWKRYLAAQIAPFLGARVLEVGAGIGTTAEHLCTADRERWVCLEPDAGQVAEIQAKIDSGLLPACCGAVTGTVAGGAGGGDFDAVLYVDVLEHIEDDRREVELALERLRPGGRLVVLAPAHQWLYTPFDESIGHFRRYTKRSLRAAVPDGLETLALRYLDSAGLAASAANRLWLRQRTPTPEQIRFWDRYLVACSRALDPALGYAIGKSVLGVWKVPGRERGRL